jgi:hypothetical protein
MFRLVVLDLRERMPVSRASPVSQASSPVRRAAGEPERGNGQGHVAAAAVRPPQAGEESQDEPLVSGDDDEELPAARVAAADLPPTGHDYLSRSAVLCSTPGRRLS